MRVILLMLAAVLAQAQSVHIDAGSANDRYFTGGFAYAYPGDPPTLKTMRYGASFSYAIPLPAGSYTVKLTFVERIVIAPGAHVFTVSVGPQTEPQAYSAFDLVQNPGVNIPLTSTFSAATDGAPLLLFFNTLTRNAIVNTIDIAPVVTPVPSAGFLSGPVTDRPVTCPGAGLMFYVVPNTSELYWCMAPGAWIKL